MLIQLPQNVLIHHFYASYLTTIVFKSYPALTKYHCNFILNHFVLILNLGLLCCVYHDSWFDKHGMIRIQHPMDQCVFMMLNLYGNTLYTLLLVLNLIIYGMFILVLLCKNQIGKFMYCLPISQSINHDYHVFLFMVFLEILHQSLYFHLVLMNKLPYNDNHLLILGYLLSWYLSKLNLILLYFSSFFLVKIYYFYNLHKL